jgi:serine/threonine protein kinase
MGLKIQNKRNNEGVLWKSPAPQSPLESPQPPQESPQPPAIRAPLTSLVPQPLPVLQALTPPIPPRRTSPPMPPARVEQQVLQPPPITPRKPSAPLEPELIREEENATIFTGIPLYSTRDIKLDQPIEYRIDKDAYLGEGAFGIVSKFRNDSYDNCKEDNKCVFKQISKTKKKDSTKTIPEIEYRNLMVHLRLSLSKERGNSSIPNIPSIYEIGYGKHKKDSSKKEYNMYVIMENTGLSLDKYVKGNSIMKKMELFKKYLIELEKLHKLELGYVHRDLKPPNITVNDNEEVYIIDLGFLGYAPLKITDQKLIDIDQKFKDLQDSGQLDIERFIKDGNIEGDCSIKDKQLDCDKQMGTAAYFSPEGINRAHRRDNNVIYGLKHDVYASGIILLALLAETSRLFNVDLIHGPQNIGELRPRSELFISEEEIKDKIILDLGDSSNNLFIKDIRSKIKEQINGREKEFSEIINCLMVLDQNQRCDYEKVLGRIDAFMGAQPKIVLNPNPIQETKVGGRKNTKKKYNKKKNKKKTIKKKNKNKKSTLKKLKKNKLKNKSRRKLRR